MEDLGTSNMSIDENQEQVKRMIQKWLLDATFKVAVMPNEHASFNFLAEDAVKRTVNVFQPINRPEEVSIATRGVLTSEQVTRIQQMAEDKRREFLWNLRFALLNIGVGFSGIESPLESIELSTTIYYDGLTRDSFMHKLFQVRRSWVLIDWMLNREFAEPPRHMGFRHSASE